MTFFYEIRGADDTVLKRDGGFASQDAAKMAAREDAKKMENTRRVAKPLRRGVNFRVAVDENEGVVKAQNSRAVILAPHGCQSQVEDRSSETLTVNQLSVNRSANHRYGLVPRP